ncbi:hypothetical protein QVD17_00215 [Tagetes erecta]|uniref:RNA-directed DNA polymerase, eukaryota, reverse transcriptase zinc-binding domain protein n=1 Tax=Tagetes erecta TaxID=13708 RepID=A0AAD8L9S1_TARER|nr:hypothetical protein QVD17_00215 [Tagetes erecta]
MEGSNLASKVLKIDGNPRCNLLKKEEATRVSSINPNLPLKADTAKRNQEAGHTHTTKSPTNSDSSHAASVDPSKSDTAKGDPSNVVHATNFSQAVNPYAHAANDNSKPKSADQDKKDGKEGATEVDGIVAENKFNVLLNQDDNQGGTSLHAQINKKKEVVNDQDVTDVEDKGDTFEALFAILRKDLEDMQKMIDASPFDSSLKDKESLCMKEFVEASSDEESFIKQKAKVNWLEKGDANTKYFHNMLKCKNNKKMIASVMRTTGEVLEGDAMINEFVNYYGSFWVVNMHNQVYQ